MGLEAIGRRAYGEVYISPSMNQELHKARYIDGRRFVYRYIYLNKSTADQAAEKYRNDGHLARVFSRKVWIKRAGYELGVEKVQGYVLYVHYDRR